MNTMDVKSPVVFHDQRMASAELFEFAQGSIGFYSARCPGKATANEDAAAIIHFDDHSGVLVVADGMGGHAAGEVAARAAIEALVTSVEEARQSDSLLRTGIINGFEQANERVQALGSGAGTTLAAVEIGGGIARPYHAGDSVILIVGSRGKIKLETTSHSPVGYGVEAGLLNADEAMNHEHRHLVLNAVGSESMRIEIGSAVKLAQRDTVLLASDGLTDNLSIQEIVERIRKGPLDRAMGRLTDDCAQRMVSQALEQPAKPDDLTVMVFRPTP